MAKQQHDHNFVPAGVQDNRGKIYFRPGEPEHKNPVPSLVYYVCKCGLAYSKVIRIVERKEGWNG